MRKSNDTEFTAKPFDGFDSLGSLTAGELSGTAKNAKQTSDYGTLAWKTLGRRQKTFFGFFYKEGINFAGERQPVFFDTRRTRLSVK